MARINPVVDELMRMQPEIAAIPEMWSEKDLAWWERLQTGKITLFGASLCMLFAWSSSV